MSPAYNAFGICAVDDNGLCGFAHYMLYPSTYWAKVTCYMQDLYVAPSARQQGLARKIISHLREVGEREGWLNIHWKTKPNNAVAMKLYDAIAEKSDFVHYVMKLKEEHWFCGVSV